jgi:hypothetical protein
MKKEKPNIEQKKWRPTRKFVTEVTIDMKTGKTTSTKSFIAKSQEEEEGLERAYSERWLDTMEILWGDKFNWFMDNIKFFVDKYGEKEFTRRWNKAMKEK